MGKPITMMAHDYAMLYAQIGQRIKDERTSRGWSQGDLCLHADVNQSRLSEIENGRRGMYLVTAIKICGAFDLPLDWLVNGG